MINRLKPMIALLMISNLSISTTSAFAQEAVVSGATPRISTDHKESLEVVKDPLTRAETLFHTAIQLQIFHRGKQAQQAMDDAYEYMEFAESIFSTNLEESDVYKINQQAGKNFVKVHPQVFEVIQEALKWAEKTDGKFDITIGAVTNLWQIGSENARVPSKEEIEQALPKIDYKKIQLDEENQAVKLEEEGMALELGGISKGYIADQVRNIFDAHGVTTAIINLGGNVIVMGTSPANEDGWNVGIQDPDETRGQIVGRRKVIDGAIVTSGIYERFIEEDGVKYHHIIDPKTGYPLDNELSATSIFTKDSTTADALSTSLFLMGLEEGLSFVESLDGVDVIFIDKNQKLYLTSGLKDDFELTNERYEVASE